MWLAAKIPCINSRQCLDRYGKIYSFAFFVAFAQLPPKQENPGSDIILWVLRSDLSASRLLTTTCNCSQVRVSGTLKCFIGPTDGLIHCPALSATNCGAGARVLCHHSSSGAFLTHSFTSFPEVNQKSFAQPFEVSCLWNRRMLPEPRVAILV